MTKSDWVAGVSEDQRAGSRSNWTTAGTVLAALLMSAGFAVAQNPAAASTPPAEQTAATPAVPGQVVEKGYVVRQTADVGGHMVAVSGSGAMYNTLINIHTGPRVLGQTFNLTPVPGTKHHLMDSLSAFSNGFGGDPINVVKLDFSKARYYEFHAIFRRDRQYFDYDLLGNPSIPSNIVIPYGLTNGVATAASLPWQQITQSPVMFNTVRRMTDVSLTIMPLAEVTYRLQYSHNIFQGPTLSPGRSILKNDLLLDEYQRNGSDEIIGAIDWKPVPLTKLTFEEQVHHYKSDSYFTLDTARFNVMEAGGLQGVIGNWYSTASPYTLSTCNTASMGSGYANATNYTIFTAPQSPGGLPIINPACDIATNYLRSQPTRTITPTETVLMQSTSIRNVSMNGNFAYTRSNSTMPNYFEQLQGLDGAIRTATFTGNTYAQRRMVSTDFGITWEATKKITLSDQVNFSNLHQPAFANITTGVTQNTPTTAGNETINYSGPFVAGAAFTISGNPSNAPLYAYFGQKFLINNATVSWEATSQATVSLTYRYRIHTIVQTSGTGPLSNMIGIDENGGILNVAYRPASNWRMNGTVEILYDDNAFTPVGPRQTKHYRFHTIYKPKPWATVSGAYNDLERHNNTNNTGTPSKDGALNHVDYNRTVGVGLDLAPTEQFSIDANYSFSDIYFATNICYLSAATAALPGTASTNAVGGPNLCPDTPTDWLARDFMSAPTHYATVGATYTPNKKIRTGAGYRLSAVNGNQFFAVAQQVNGSLHSNYRTPYVNLAWTLHPGLIWRAEYIYYGYGEGGPSGAPFCSTSTATTSVVVPCNSASLSGLPTGLTEPTSGLTLPRTTHANAVTLAIHYEF